MYGYTISISLQVGVFDTYGTQGTEPSLCEMVVVKHKSNVKLYTLRYRSIRKAANGGDILKNLVSLLLSSVYLMTEAIYKILSASYQILQDTFAILVFDVIEHIPKENTNENTYHLNAQKR